MNTPWPKRNLILILVGVAGLLVKRPLADALGDIFYSYWGNVTASFAVYFLVSIAAGARLNRVWMAALALVVVEACEFTNGFGIMTNVYDPFDYLANALGVALAYFVDLILTGTKLVRQQGDGA